MSTSAEQSAAAHLSRDVVVLDRSSRLRFLLIEDSDSECELVRSLLEDEFPNGYIDASTSLKDALQLLTESEYDLVLADLTLPDADGGNVVRAVREASPQTALMVLTGRNDGTLALWALAEGAQDYLVKDEHNGPRLADALLRGLQRSRAEKLTHTLLVEALKHESESSEELRVLNRAKDDFVATVSHELRTPLSSISGYAEMLQEEVSLTARQIGFVDAIARNAARLTALTYDLLLLSGLSAHEVQTVALEVDLRGVVSRAREVVLALAAGLDLDVSFDLPDHPALVTGDPGHLERIVLNLTSNAIKFSESGGSVNCRVLVNTTDVLLEVSDTGVGIPKDELEELFTRFFRGSSARQRAIQGTGLGLHIVASLVANHAGAVTVESAEGRGTTFTVRLPRVSTPARNEVPATVADGEPIVLDVLGTSTELAAEIRRVRDTVANSVTETMLSRHPDWIERYSDQSTAHHVAAGHHVDFLRAAVELDNTAIFRDYVLWRRDVLSARGITVRLLVEKLEAIRDELAGRLSPRATEAASRAMSAGLEALAAGDTLTQANGSPLSPTCRLYLEASIRGRCEEALEIAREAVRSAESLVDVYIDIFQSALYEVGRRWQTAGLSIAEEHMASATTQSILSVLHDEQPRTRGLAGTAVVTGVVNEQHIVGASIVANALDAEGWDVRFMGANLPHDAIVSAIANTQASLVAISVTMSDHVADARDLIAHIRRSSANPPRIIVGGAAFIRDEHLWRTVGADGYALDARSVAELARS